MVNVRRGIFHLSFFSFFQKKKVFFFFIEVTCLLLYTLCPVYCSSYEMFVFSFFFFSSFFFLDVCLLNPCLVNEEKGYSRVW